MKIKRVYRKEIIVDTEKTRQTQKLYIVMYHYVRDIANSRYPNIRGLDISSFKKQIFFLKQNFQIVTMEEVIAHYQENYELPENALLLTFDDGYQDHYINVFPLLDELKIQGSFFVSGKTFMEHSLLDVNKIHFILEESNTTVLMQDLFDKLDFYRGVEFAYPSNAELFKEHAVANRFDSKEIIFIKRILQNVLPERLRTQIASQMFEEHVGVKEQIFARELYLNYDQMKLMKRCGMFFGVHGYDHYWMNKLTPSELGQDINKALASMQGLIDMNNWVINYPYGSFSDEVIDFVKAKGSTIGLSTEVRIADLRNDNPHKLPRLDTNDFPPKSTEYLQI